MTDTPTPAITPLPPAPSSADPSTFNALAEDFVAALGPFVEEANQFAEDLEERFGNAQIAVNGSSTSSVSIAAGGKSFTVASGRAWAAGMWLMVASAANPTTHFMVGQVTSYADTSLVLAVTMAIGSGTRNDWQISLSGPPATKESVGLSNVQNLAPADMPISSDVQEALDEKANIAAVMTTDEDYALSPADAGKYIRIGDSAALEITIAPEATTEQPANAEWHFRALGDVEFIAPSGVTVNAPHGGTLAMEEGMTVTLKRVAADEFDLLGQTVDAE